MEDRKVTLLKATYALLKKCSRGPYVKDVLTETVYYDGGDCDGTCLMEDIRTELAEHRKNQGVIADEA